MIRALCAAAAALLVSAAAPAPHPTWSGGEPRIEYNAIALIECGTGEDARSGTAFWIDRDRIVTAAHVTKGEPCSIGGHPLRIVREDPRADIAELAGLENDHSLEASCSAAREGDVIFAVGYPDGLYRHTARLLATIERVQGEEPSAEGELMLVGRVFPGMSGGPELDRHGRVRGITNRRYFDTPMATSRALADTFICA